MSRSKKLWHFHGGDRVGYDIYLQFLVVASTHDEAMRVIETKLKANSSPNAPWRQKEIDFWKGVRGKYIGDLHESREACIYMDSFNAG